MDTAVTSIETKTRHIANLVQLGLYFYFGSCIYTNYTRYPWTVQLRKLIDFMFFVGGQLLPDDALIDWFQHVTHIVFNLDKQKSEVRSESVLHFRSKSVAASPVWAGVNVFLRTRNKGACCTLLSVTIMTRTRGSDLSGPLTSSLSSETRWIGLTQTDSVFP